MTDAGRPVGQWLREVRESKGLSHADVAQRLHLRPSVVAAIESGQSDQLPAEIFLRGYVKAYARLLELDEKQVLDGLGSSGPGVAVTEPAIGDSSRPRRADARRRIAVTVFSLVVLLAAALGYWLFPESGPETVPSADIVAVPSEPVVAEPVVEGDGVPAEMLAPEAQPVFPVVEAPLSTSRDESDSADTNSAPDLSAVSPSLLPPPLAAAQVQQAAESDVDDAQTVTQAVAGKGSLLIRFTGDCWLELFDGDGHKVIASLKGAGEEFRYQGNLPFRVVLGAVSNVQVEFNGAPFDFSDVRVRGNRAQFLLDAERQ